MGADIHIFPEYRVDGGAWQSHPDITVELEDKGTAYEFTYISYNSGIHRDYNLFAALAGVRGRGPEPKGLPPGISPIVQQAIDNWEGDGHSYSYISLEDFAVVLRDRGYRNIGELAIFKSCKKIYKELSEIDKILLDSEKGSTVEFRVIFFFDN